MRKSTTLVMLLTIITFFVIIVDINAKPKHRLINTPQLIDTVKFEDYFCDSTLRLDYVFAGDNHSQHIFFHQASKSKRWAGRRHNLSELFLKGNGQITIRDTESQKIIYTNSFSTLFQEWQTEEEATKVSKSFENSYIVPFPRSSIKVTITLSDTHGKITSELSHTIDPSDILIRDMSSHTNKYDYVLQNGDLSSCIDIAILSEGYTLDEMDKFHNDCNRTIEALFSHEPFTSLKSRFNIVAVECPSTLSGPTIPRENRWNNLSCGTQYDTFYTDRYLMTSKMWDVYNQLDNIPFEHIIILVNSSLYGGGGIFNQINVFPSDHPTFKPLLVHEFGHGYGGLADEYYYDDQYETKYPSDTEPWEPNITTLVDFGKKWKNLLPKETTIPTPERKEFPISFSQTDFMRYLTSTVGVFEGGGYQSKGVYRPAQECRMKVLEVEDFCPVCKRALIDITNFYTQ